MMNFIIGILIGITVIILSELISGVSVKNVGITVYSKDLVCCVVVFVSGVLTGMGRISGDTFSSIVGVIVGYYFGRGLRIRRCSRR